MKPPLRNMAPTTKAPAKGSFKPNWRAVWIIIVIASLFMSGCGSDKTVVQAEPAASSQELEENAEEENLDPLGIKLEAQHYARVFGVSEDEALRRFGRDDELKAMLQEIVAAETGRVAGWGLVHDPEFGGWVYLVGDADPTAFTKQLAAQHSDLFVELGATHTFDELLAALENNVDREEIPVSMRDRIAYTEIDITLQQHRCCYQPRRTPSSYR